MTTFIERTFSPAIARHLQEEGFCPAMARVLAARGIETVEDLKPDWRAMLAPQKLDGTTNAAKLLADAIEQNKKIMVVADYDCDGATACAVAIRGLRAMGAKVDYIVPDRFIYGYGLTPEIVDLAARHSPEVILTVDNGMASIEGVKRASELGIDVIITDHHLPGQTLPAAQCIVNPNTPGCAFPSKNLAGVGVMFYVLMALRAELRTRGRFNQQTQPKLNALVDLVALGTVADVVKLDRNNRILVEQGLNLVRRGLTQPGLAALFEVAGRPLAQAKARDFGFVIAPRINAAGRLDLMNAGIECLISDDPTIAKDFAIKLDEFNRERRELELNMQWDARMLLNRENFADRHTITLFEPGWHQGIVGLVASRVKDSRHRPTVAFASAGEDELKGSGRSIEGVHLRDMLDLVTKKAPGIIKKFGGHAMAAGLTIEANALDAFTEAFEEVVTENTDPDTFERHVLVDGPLTSDEINESLIDAINAQSWGQGFLPPLFANEFKVLRQTALKGGHLKLVLEMPDGMRFSAIYFRRAAEIPTRAVLAYRPEINEWMGRRNIQLVVEQFQSD
ncbi:MAG TPA: single-stranded-DNA-specific exonuclease RecJ [Candidatus Aphodousia faecipullorum]|nr:single-stranded-DNA-specific exonuclease RecJ [Candidatus Aphodousia faecipullorum]